MAVMVTAPTGVDKAVGGEGRKEENEKGNGGRG